MNRIRTVLWRVAVCTVFLALAGCTPKRDAPAQNQTVKTEISLPTMKCKTCEETITNAIKTLDGVKGVTVSVDEKKATVEYTADKLDRSAIERAIANAGYDADTVKRNETAFSALLPCCQMQRNGE